MSKSAPYISVSIQRENIQDASVDLTNLQINYKVWHQFHLHLMHWWNLFTNVFHVTDPMAD